MIIDNTPYVRANQFAGMFALASADLFAGGGGWSIGAEQAFVEGGYRDRYFDLMINHWSVAVGVHSANHPMTDHMKASVWEVDPDDVLPGRQLGYLHASPDCTHFSKARGKKPVKKEIRALADVVLVWADKRRPLVITLENVPEFLTWGPLGRDGQPDKARAGQEFKRWKKHLEQLGYVVEHRVLVACDYGAPTSRKRLFVIARCDGKPIIWPEKTHEPKEKMGSLQDGSNVDHADRRMDSRSHQNYGLGRMERDAFRCRGNSSRGVYGRNELRLKPYRTTAEIVDWSIPMLSIFATPAEAKAFARLHGCGVPRRPLKAKTMQRIARGLVKFVLQGKPYLINIQNYGWGSSPVVGVDQPMPTVTGSPRGGAYAAVDATIAPYTVPNLGERDGQQPRCGSVEQPMPTITGTGSGARLVSAFLSKHLGRDVEMPLPTITGQGNHASLVAAFLSTYYGNTQDGQAIDTPAPTIVGKDRIQLVTVKIDGQAYVVTDIAMRMLTPRELARAQGFPDDYIIDRQADGTPVSKADQVKLIGNSVPPAFARAIVKANVVDLGVLDEQPAEMGVA